MYLLHEVLSALLHLSRTFQSGNISFSANNPAIKYTTYQLVEIAAEQKSEERLRQRWQASQHGHNSASSENFLRNLTTKYVDLLKENIENRFLESLPVLSAFEIFDPNSIPDR